MKDRGETLADLAIRETYRRDNRVSRQLRDRLARARKFVLDGEMSAFLADLMNAPWVDSKRDRAIRLIDGARQQARAPHALTWIEYDAYAKVLRSREAYGHLYTPEELAKTIHDTRAGLLIEQVGAAEFDLYVILLDAGGDVEHSPLVFRWSCEGDLPGLRNEAPIVALSVEDEARQLFSSLSSHATGIGGYHSKAASAWVMQRDDGSEWDRDVVNETIAQMRTILRVTWAFLATINDLPTTVEAVRPSKGYVAKGRYRRFCEHSVIHLRVPQHRRVRVAAQMVALIRRRAHIVRGHWRKDYRHQGMALCEHEWISAEGTMSCRHCGRKRLWIGEHQRGDASLGFVLHDYTVERGKRGSEAA